jgi:hypothetical protein
MPRMVPFTPLWKRPRVRLLSSNMIGWPIIFHRSAACDSSYGHDLPLLRPEAERSPKLLNCRHERENEGHRPQRCCRTHGRPSGQECRLRQDEAEKLVRIGLKKNKLKEEALERLPGSDERKVAIAESIHRNTTVSQAWIAERLQMKSAANVSQQLGRKREPERASVR